mmetsp:Transcript_3427/g.8562  ORF Transcript_3427/g.8562 Transcript_3427/m.8562 type:complete len:214 (+) Transcript_3427:980-1621(+)
MANGSPAERRNTVSPPWCADCNSERSQVAGRALTAALRERSSATQRASKPTAAFSMAPLCRVVSSVRKHSSPQRCNVAAGSSAASLPPPPPAISESSANAAFASSSATTSFAAAARAAATSFIVSQHSTTSSLPAREPAVLPSRSSPLPSSSKWSGTEPPPMSGIATSCLLGSVASRPSVDGSEIMPSTNSVACSLALTSCSSAAAIRARAAG